MPDIRELTLRVSTDTKDLRKLGNEIKRLGLEFQSPQTQARKLTEETRRLERQGVGAFGRVGRGAKRLRRSIRGIRGSIRGATVEFKRLTLAGLTVGAIQSVFQNIKRAIAETIRTGVELEASLTKIQALVGVNADQVDQWGQALRSIGPATGRSLPELADALFFISSAGVRGQEALDVLTASAKAAAVGLGETKTVADLVTSAVNAYGPEVLSASQATDTLVAAVREGKAEADEIAASIGAVLPIASNLGVSFDQATAAIAAMTRTGSNAAEASTQLSAVLSSFLNSTPQAEKALEGVGLSFNLLRSSIREDGLLTALIDVQKATKDLGDEALAEIFPNVRALRGVLDLLSGDLQNTNELFTAVRDSAGATDEAFEKTRGTTRFLYDQLKSELGVVMAELSDALLPALNISIKAITGTLRGLRMTVAAVIKPFRDLKTIIQEVTGDDEILGIKARFEIASELNEEELRKEIADLQKRIQEIGVDNSGGFSLSSVFSFILPVTASVVSDTATLVNLNKRLKEATANLEAINLTPLQLLRKELAEINAEITNLENRDFGRNRRGAANARDKIDLLKERRLEVEGLVEAETQRATQTKATTEVDKEAVKTNNELVKSLQDQAAELRKNIAAFGLTEKELIDYNKRQAIAAGATAETAEEVAELQKQLLQLQRSKALDVELETIRVGNLTDVERQREELQESVRTLNLGLETGKLTAEEYTDQLMRLVGQGKEGFDQISKTSEETGNAMAQFWSDTMSRIRDTFSDLFFNVVTGNFKNLGDIAKSTFRAIARSATQLFSQNFTQGIFTRLSGGAGQQGGVLSSAANLLLPQGGVAGTTVAGGTGGGVGGVGGLGFAATSLVESIPGFGIGGVFGSPVPDLPGVSSLLGTSTNSGFLGGALNTGTANFLGAIGAGVNIFSGFRSSFEEGIGASAGAAAGAAIGSIIPGIGTLVGAGIGSFLGKIFGGLFRKSPKLRISILEGVKVSDILGGENAFGVSSRRFDGGPVRDAFNQQIQNIAQSLVQIIEALPRDIEEELITILNNTDVDYFSFYHKSKRASNVAKAFENYVSSGGLAGDFLSSIDDFFAEAFNSLGVGFIRSQELVKDFQIALANATDETRPQVVAEFLELFGQIGDLSTAISSIGLDNISESIKEFTEVSRDLGSRSGILSLDDLARQARLLLGAFDDPEAIQNVLEMRQAILSLAGALSQTTRRLVGFVDQISIGLGELDADYSEYLQGTADVLIRVLGQTTLSLQDRDAALQELANVTGQLQQLEQRTFQARLTALNEEFTAAQNLANIAQGARSALDNIIFSAGSPVSGNDQIDLLQQRILGTTSPEVLTDLYQRLFSTAQSTFQAGSSETQAIFQQVVAGLENIASLAPERSVEQIQAEIGITTREMSDNLRDLYTYMRDEGISILERRLLELQALVAEGNLERQRSIVPDGVRANYYFVRQ